MQESVIRDDAHEERVRKYWRDALIDWMRAKVQSVREGSFLFRYYTSKVILSEEAQGAAVTFLTDHFDWTADHAECRIDTCSKEAIRKWANKRLANAFGLIVFVFGMLLIAAAVNEQANYRLMETRPWFLLGVLLLGLVLLIPVLYLVNAKALAQRRARARYGDTPEVLEAYCDIQEAGAWANLGRRALAVCGALTLCAAIGGILLLQPPTLARQVADALRYDWNIPEKELDVCLLTDGQLGERGRRAIDEVLKNSEPGSAKALILAAYAHLKTAAGYPEAAAREALTAQIAAMDPEVYYSDSLIRQLLERIPWARDPLFDRYAGADAYNAESVLKLIAEHCQDEPLEDRAARALRITGKRLTAADFLSRSLTPEDLPALGGLLAEADDPERRALYAGALADQPNLPGDIVPVLYRLRERGAALREVFPNGVRLSLALTGVNPPAEPLPEANAPLSGSRYLILSRTEQDEPAESLKTPPAEGYDGHDKADPTLFDVSIEAALMDRLPLERQPAAWQDCDFLILSDMMFICQGSIRDDDRTASKGETTVTTRYYPIYDRLYRLLLADPDGVPRRLIASRTLSVSTDQQVNRWINHSTGAGIVYWEGAPRPDKTWAGTQLGLFLNSLEAAGWEIARWAEAAE